MLRWIAAALVVAAAIALAHDPARSMEALALKVIGFSPDGRYFGFVQYGGQGDGGEYLAETYVIDTSRDRFAPGVPVRINTVDEEAIAEEAEDPAKLLALAMKRSQALIKIAAVAVNPIDTYIRGGMIAMPLRYRELSDFVFLVVIGLPLW
jgi:predicted secreted protein